MAAILELDEAMNKHYKIFQAAPAVNFINVHMLVVVIKKNINQIFVNITFVFYMDVVIWHMHVDIVMNVLNYMPTCAISFCN